LFRISAGYPSYPGGARHRGIDFATPEGSVVYSVSYGTVVAVDSSHVNNWNTYSIPGDHSYGNYVKIKMNDEKTTIIYAHMQSVIPVTVGQKVSVGTPIGFSGNTGHSSGPHLHFEVNQAGEVISPLPYLPDLSGVEGVYKRN
jgi:murein DD-endopeptidase MepM/ murein hydrolase activator NlpD